MIKIVCCLLVALCASTVQGQFTFGANLSPQSPTDIPGVYGTLRVRTEGDNLIFDSSLYNAVDITAVQIHLTPGKGAIDGGPLLLPLTNTSAQVGLAPLSSKGSSPLLQSGSRNTANLLANPQLAAARAKLVELGQGSNLLQNIGDVDRLLRAGLLYSDVHSVVRPPPSGVVRGQISALPATNGRKLLTI